MQSNQIRVPAGVPTGGEFTSHTRTPADVSLNAAYDFLDENRRQSIIDNGPVTLDRDSLVPASVIVEGADRVTLKQAKNGAFVAVAEFDHVDLVALAYDPLSADHFTEVWFDKHSEVLDEHFKDRWIRRSGPWTDATLAFTVNVTDPADEVVCFSRAADAFEKDEDDMVAFQGLRNGTSTVFIDDMQQEVDDNACYECGASLDDGEGSGGLCGDCADRASCPECGEYSEDGEVCADCEDED